MRLLVLNGSMRKNGQCARLIEHITARMRRLLPDLETQIVHAADTSLEPCRVTCDRFCIDHPFRCLLEDDLTGILEKMRQANGLLLASPLYTVIPAVLNTLLERLVGLAFHAEEHGQVSASPFLGKPCGLVAVAEYADPMHVLEHLHRVALVLQLQPVRVGRYPYLGVSGQGTLEDRGPLRPFERATELAEKLAAGVTSAFHGGSEHR